MGTCCANRPHKVPAPSPVRVAKRRIERHPSVPSPAPAPVAQSVLHPFSTLGLKCRTSVDQALKQRITTHREYGQETLLGFISVKQILKGQEKVVRVLVCSNYALYFFDPLAYTLESSCEVLNVLLMTLDPLHTAAILHQPLELGGDVWIVSEVVVGILENVEKSFYSKRNKYVPCTTAQDASELPDLFNRRSRENLISYHSPEYEEITRVIVEYGKMGENRVFFRKTKSCSSEFPVLEDSFVLVTTANIYILKSDYGLKKKISLSDIWGVSVADDDSCQALASSSQSYLCYLDKAFRRLMEEILMAKGLKLSVKKRTDIEGRFRKGYQPD